MFVSGDGETNSLGRLAFVVEVGLLDSGECAENSTDELSFVVEVGLLDIGEGETN